jgi:RHS repeat-associated protein
VDPGITSLEGMLSLPEMTYGPSNRLATYNSEAVQFDADGNMTHGPLGGAMVSFNYDSRRRLTQAGTTQYVYDAENHRIGVDGTHFVVNSQPALSQVLVKTAADGAQTFYVYGLGLIGEESAAGYKAYHSDFRGSTVALSDTVGAVAEQFQYGPYGELVAGNNASQTPFLFNGMYGVMTDGNGLYYMRARFYSAEIKRFLNRDVLLGSAANGQSLNRFAYVNGRPVKLIDPFGLEAILPSGGSRKLTDGEVLLVKSVFGDAVNCGLITIYRDKFVFFQPENVAMAPDGNIYFHPNGWLYRDDFSQEYIDLQALFIHEITHVWQHQVEKIDVMIRGMCEREYKYLPLEPGKQFTDYGIEQQGDIVRDYFLLKYGEIVEGAPSIEEYEKILPFVGDN